MLVLTEVGDPPDVPDFTAISVNLIFIFVSKGTVVPNVKLASSVVDEPFTTSFISLNIPAVVSWAILVFK
jgi:hypothetical protein